MVYQFLLSEFLENTTVQWRLFRKIQILKTVMEILVQMKILYIFIQDGNEPETYDKDTFENDAMNSWFRSARSWYRKDREGDTSKVPKSNPTLEPKIYQLSIE
jgi:hypothetical protein